MASGVRLSEVTETKSLCAAYEFTTLTCIPGNLMYNGTKIQLLDLPGIIEGAAHGKGRGKEVISVAKTADLILMVLDGGKEQVNRHREILENELETVGLRLNKQPPNVTLVPNKIGGVKINKTVNLTKLGDDPVTRSMGPAGKDIYFSLGLGIATETKRATALTWPYRPLAAACPFLGNRTDLSREKKQLVGACLGEAKTS